MLWGDRRFSPTPLSSDLPTWVVGVYGAARPAEASVAF